VREARGAHAWTLRDLSERSGVSLRFLVQLEAGTGNISVRRLAALAEALNTTPAALLSEGGEAARAGVIALLGLRGAGKTTVGRRLARRLRVPFVELDRRIEQAANLTLGEIFSLHGEEYYRRLEREALLEVLDSGTPMVLATGGGLVASPDTYALLRRHALTVWLRAAPEDHWNRVVQQGDRRPMADHPQAMSDLRTLLASREPLYAAAAIAVDTSKRSVDDVVKVIEGALPEARGQAKPRRSATREGGGPEARGVAAPPRRSAERRNPGPHTRRRRADVRTAKAGTRT
jgi:XRE family transcriptional regulator, aerobic/anaerobic benzoate catabolism transcriptional regulator